MDSQPSQRLSDSALASLRSYSYDIGDAVLHFIEQGKDPNALQTWVEHAQAHALNVKKLAEKEDECRFAYDTAKREANSAKEKADRVWSHLRCVAAIIAEEKEPHA